MCGCCPVCRQSPPSTNRSRPHRELRLPSGTRGSGKSERRGDCPQERLKAAHKNTRRFAQVLPNRKLRFQTTHFRAKIQSPLRISQIATAPLRLKSRWAATPPRSSRASREGGSGDQGDLAACPQTLLVPCIVARGQSHLGIRFATRVNIPLDPPIPRRGRARVRRMANGCRGADPLRSA